MHEKLSRFYRGLSDGCMTCSCLSALMVFLSDITGLKVFVIMLCPMLLGATACLWVVAFIFRRYLDVD